MMMIDHHTILKAEPFIVTGEPWFWGEARENGKDELVWEFENCENGMGHISARSKGAV